MSWNCPVWMDLWQIKLVSWPLKCYYWFYSGIKYFFHPGQFFCVLLFGPVVASPSQCSHSQAPPPCGHFCCGLCPSSSLFGDSRLHNFPFLCALHRCCPWDAPHIYISSLCLAADRDLCLLPDSCSNQPAEISSCIIFLLQVSATFCEASVRERDHHSTGDATHMYFFSSKLPLVQTHCGLWTKRFAHPSASISHAALAASLLSLHLGSGLGSLLLSLLWSEIGPVLTWSFNKSLYFI